MLPWLTLALAAPPILVVKAEPLGSGDDRTATAIEERVRAAGPAWLTCWADHAATDSLRNIQIELAMRSTRGDVRKATVLSGTGTEALDACALTLARAIVLDPPPVYGDHVRASITWMLAPEDRPPVTP